VLIAIDPGYAKRGPGCACALFVEGLLTALWFARPNEARPVAPDGADVVYELPQMRPREDVSPGKANTLIKLAAVGAELAGQYSGASGGRVYAVTPAAWKGSTPKPQSHGRILDVLSRAELAIVGADAMARVAEAKRRGALDRWARPGADYYGTWPRHNLLDAVGIGVHHLGRRIDQ